LHSPPFLLFFFEALNQKEKLAQAEACGYRIRGGGAQQPLFGAQCAPYI